MGIRDKPIAPGSPWQNGFVERLIGSIRRECVDHVVALGEQWRRYFTFRHRAPADRKLERHQVGYHPTYPT
jgi:transposase InsO family protein